MHRKVSKNSIMKKKIVLFFFSFYVGVGGVGGGGGIMASVGFFISETNAKMPAISIKIPAINSSQKPNDKKERPTGRIRLSVMTKAIGERILSIPPTKSIIGESSPLCSLIVTLPINPRFSPIIVNTGITITSNPCWVERNIENRYHMG